MMTPKLLEQRVSLPIIREITTLTAKEGVVFGTKWTQTRNWNCRGLSKTMLNAGRNSNARLSGSFAKLHLLKSLQNVKIILYIKLNS